MAIEAVSEEVSSRSSPILSGVFFLILSLLCLRVLSDGVRQFRTSGFPATNGMITRFVWEDAGDAGRALTIAYRYEVGKRIYQGDRVRFIFRPFRIGLADATARALTWGAGRKVQVFYDPGNPETALLDKGLTTGDWLFLALVFAVLIVSLAGIRRSIISWLRRRC
jgi:hypothetical protein